MPVWFFDRPPLTAKQRRALADEIAAKARAARRAIEARERAKWDRIKSDFARARSHRAAAA